MQTKTGMRILDERRRSEERRLDVIQHRIADGEIASMSNDSKWEKIFAELRPVVRWDAPVWVKLVDSDTLMNRPGLFHAYIDRGHVEHPDGLLLLVFLEWVKFAVADEPRFPFQVDYELDGSELTIFGYRRMSR